MPTSFSSKEILVIHKHHYPLTTQAHKPKTPSPQRETLDGPVVVDLFAGCGGLSLGLEQAGFHPVFVSELNQDALDTYLVNREHLQTGPSLRDEFNINDVKKLLDNGGNKLDEILVKLEDRWGIGRGEIDLVAGGPPCQGFSGIGHRRSYSVEKTELPSNHLFQDMAEVIKRIQPRMFLFENVRGLLSARWTKESEKGGIWRDVKKAFDDIDGYTVRHAEVRAREYGVPQNRPRVLLVGIRDDVAKNAVWTVDRHGRANGLLPEPIEETAPNLVDVLGDLLDPIEKHWKGPKPKTSTYPLGAKKPIQRYYRQDKHDPDKVARKGSTLSDHEYSHHSKKIYAKFDAMHANENGEIPKRFRTKKFAQRLLPAKWGSDGPSITATSLPDDYVHYNQSRTLTVREWARLQGFPDWYEFKGKRTTGGIRRAGNPREGIHFRELPKYTQIGNAVPVPLARAVGKHFRKLLGR